MFLHGDGLLVHCGYAEEPGCEKSYHGMFFFSRTFFLSAAGPPKFRWFKLAKSKGKVHELNPKAQTRGENLFEFFLVDIPVGFKMFGQPALSHIPLANVAEYFLLIIIYCVTLLLFVRAFNTHSIHSIELVTILFFLQFVHFLPSILL